MTDTIPITKRLSGIPPGRCIHTEKEKLPMPELSAIADKMIVEYDRLGTLGRDIEAPDWELFNSLDEQLWETPAATIGDLAAKARVLDKRLRIDGEAHSTSDQVWDLIDELLALSARS
jgi:hypothetical protein